MARGISREHRPQRASAKNVDMEVRDLLSRIHADVAEQTIAAGHERLVAGNLAHSPHESGDLLGWRALRKIVPRDVASLGNDQNVDWRQRINVMEGQGVLVLVHLVRGDLAA